MENNVQRKTVCKIKNLEVTQMPVSRSWWANESVSIQWNIMQQQKLIDYIFMHSMGEF